MGTTPKSSSSHEKLPFIHRCYQMPKKRERKKVLVIVYLMVKRLKKKIHLM
jgi:hypothetical protein